MFFRIANRTIDKLGRILRALLTVPVHHERDRRQEIDDAENARLKAEAEARFEVLLEAAKIRTAELNKTVGCTVSQVSVLLSCETQDTHQPENQMQRRAEVFEALDEAKDCRASLLCVEKR